MFGFTIISKRRLRELESGYNRWHHLASTRYWFSGFPALTKVLDFYASAGMTYTLDRIRSDYAKAMGTDDYGVPLSGESETSPPKTPQHP